MHDEWYPERPSEPGDELSEFLSDLLAWTVTVMMGFVVVVMVILAT